MTKQEHIETVEQVIWDWIQSHYQESCYTTELGKFTDALCDFWKIYNNNKSEIERLKAENIRLTTKLGQVLLSIDTVKEMNTMCNIEEQVKQAKIDVLNELKKKIHDTRLNDDTAEIIIEMIEEVQNAKDKS